MSKKDTKWLLLIDSGLKIFGSLKFLFMTVIGCIELKRRKRLASHPTKCELQIYVITYNK